MTDPRRVTYVGILILAVATSALAAQQPADVDYDGSGIVDFGDFVLFAQAFGSTQSLYDLDGSGRVDFADFVLFSGLFGRRVGEPDVGPHHPGEHCLGCHRDLTVAGTVYSDSTGSLVQRGIPISLTAPDGSELVIEKTGPTGNLASPLVPDGSYLVRVGDVTSRTWHAIPRQGSCNTCHAPGDSDSDSIAVVFPALHTQIPAGNSCTHCHHFPATRSISQLKAAGALNAAVVPPGPPGSQVDLLGRIISFDPSEHQINTVRPDIFAPGNFSMFDAILAAARKEDISVEYHYDDDCKTHFITRFDGVPGDYWYHFSYDAGSGNRGEIRYRRAHRWDEALWRPGVWVQLVKGEDLAAIEQEYVEEIAREKAQGHVIPQVRIALNPSDFSGNPPESGRITVERRFTDVKVTAHNLRATGHPSPYSKPFQPGVATSMDLLLSLKDQGELDLVTAAFYTRFAGNWIDSYYVVAMGFPGVGTAHASGRQGFVYVTNNGTPGRLPNNADGKFHMTSDIAVLHAPDFSYWRWIELGSPDYAIRGGTNRSSGDSLSIQEDYDAIGRGFNLHAPVFDQADSSVAISFNIFEPGRVVVSGYTSSDRAIQTLFDGPVERLGVHTLRWRTGSSAPRKAYLLMRFGQHAQIRRLVLN